MTMNRGEDPGHPWVKASRSTSGSNCVEMRRGAVDGVEVRDSKSPDGPTLRFSGAQFAAWLDDGADSGGYAHLTG
jgi:hypothetical protein